MSILINMEMPKNCISCRFCKAYMASTDSKNYKEYFYCRVLDKVKGENDCPLIEVPKHGDLIDRDALMKDGWLCLHKEVMRMGGYAIHELPLINPTIPVVIEAEGEE